MFRPIWSLSGASKLILETDPLPSMNIIKKFAPFYDSMCCTFVVLGDSSYVSYAVVNTTRKRNRTVFSSKE